MLSEEWIPIGFKDEIPKQAKLFRWEAKLLKFYMVPSNSRKRQDLNVEGSNNLLPTAENIEEENCAIPLVSEM